MSRSGGTEKVQSTVRYWLRMYAASFLSLSWLFLLPGGMVSAVQVFARGVPQQLNMPSVSEAGARSAADHKSGAVDSGDSGSREELLWLAVDKSTMRADLRTLSHPESGRASALLRSFRIATGKQAGDKEREGDNKTPEGIYFALPHIDANKLLASKYGRRAIPLNYPNPIDQIEGKTGYGIWLHGAGDNKRIVDANVTEGCVAFYNADILRLKPWIRPHQSLVVIARDLDLVNQQQDRRQVLNATRSWLEAWESRNLDQYISHYSAKFKQGGRTRSAFRQYKDRVFRSYQKIAIINSGLWVLTHPKYAVSFMNQDFRGDRTFHSVGRKILYWVREEGSWKIIAEKFNNELFRPLAFNNEDLQQLNRADLVQAGPQAGHGEL